MPHEQTINTTNYWDHEYFAGRRVNKPNGNPDSSKSWWSIVYARYASEEAALAGERPLEKAGRLLVRGDLLDTYLLNAGGTGYEMTDAKVFALLKKCLSKDFTESELADTEGVARARQAMLGVEMFGGAFTVAELVVVSE